MIQPNKFYVATYRAAGESEAGLVGMIDNIAVTFFARKGQMLYDLLASVEEQPVWLYGQGPTPDAEAQGK